MARLGALRQGLKLGHSGGDILIKRNAVVILETDFFNAPPLHSHFVTKGWLTGNLTTDFGAPDALFPDDWGRFH